MNFNNDEFKTLLSNLNSNHLEKLANLTVTEKFESNRDLFYSQIHPILKKWTFEEVFVFTIELFNDVLYTVAHEEEPVKAKDLQIEDFFPHVYEELYEDFLFSICERYRKQNLN